MAQELSPDAFETIRQLMRLVAENALSELTISESSGFSVTVKSYSAESESAFSTQPLPAAQYLPQRIPTAPAHLPVPATNRAPAGSSEAKGRSTDAVAMGAPMMGIFYEAPAPGEPPFVQVGDIIQVGSVIGLIEAMKVYSEIPSEVPGRIVEIVVKTGGLVQLDEPLIYVEPV